MLFPRNNKMLECMPLSPAALVRFLVCDWHDMVASDRLTMDERQLNSALADDLIRKRASADDLDQCFRR